MSSDNPKKPFNPSTRLGNTTSPLAMHLESEKLSDNLLLKQFEQTLTDWLLANLPSAGVKQPLYIAYSGGMDSAVLLHGLHRMIYLDNDFRGRFLLKALHVNHQLQVEAYDWVDFCCRQAERLQVPFDCKSLQLQGFSRQGIESVARKARYQALIDMVAADIEVLQADQADLKLAKPMLLLAHHQRDQAETVLLNLFRGAGVSGLAGMPKTRRLAYSDEEAGTSECVMQRPLLKLSYQVLHAYAKDFDVKFIEDPSNQDNQFRRNWLRNQLLPEIETKWPDIQQKLADTADYMFEANVLLDKLAEQELGKFVFSYDFIELKPLAQMPWLDQKNIIRYWTQVFYPGMVLAKKHYQWLESLILSLQSAEKIRSAAYKLSDYELRWQYQRLYILPKWFTEEANPLLNKYERGIGVLVFSQMAGNEAGDVLLKNALNIQYAFKFNVLEDKEELVCKPLSSVSNMGLKSKSLKRFFQQAKIPPWLRPFWPVLENRNGELLAVLGCEKCLSEVNESDDFQMLEISYLQLLKVLQLRY